MRRRFGPNIVAATDRRVRELVSARRQLRMTASNESAINEATIYMCMVFV